jgi:hypothetical protein
VFVYLANTAVSCYSLTIICCCQVQDYVYWIISIENYHRHHHKFIKYEKRLRKEGKNMLGLPIKQNLCHFSASSFQRSNCICSIWKILHFYSSFSLNPSKSTFFHALTLSLLPKNHMLFIVSKQCACSRRVHIEGHMNRFEFLLSWTMIPITIVLGLFCQKIVSFAA